MEVIILGSGFSFGVPVIGCKCTTCISTNKYNKRRRPSIVIIKERTKILVDFGADIRQQLLDNQINDINCAICTHNHADHIAGIDDLRIFSNRGQKLVEIYSDKKTITDLNQMFPYLFRDTDYRNKSLESKIIDFYEKINVSDIDIQFFMQNHYPIKSLGIRIKDFVYSIDVRDFPEESKKHLVNIDKWIIDCIDYQSTAPHSGLEQIFEWDKEFKPKEIYLTNLSHNLDFEELSKKLPKHIKPCYDGMKIKID